MSDQDGIGAMRIGRFRGLGVGVLAAALLSGSPHGTVEAAQPCERVCLEGFVDRYLQAMQAHDPKRAPIAADAKYTENGQKLELGDGLWRNFTAPGSYRLLVDDVDAGHVAFLGSIREADTPAMLALHLRVRKGRITAAEALVQRNEKSALGFEQIGYTWHEPIPAGERRSRADLLRSANAWFSGPQLNEEGSRIENGAFVTDVPTPPGQTRIRDRRFVAIDPDNGLVFSYVFFDHMGPQQPWTWETAEIFRLEHGRVHQVMAIMEKVPYGMSSGWSSWEDGMSSEARDASK